MIRSYDVENKAVKLLKRAIDIFAKGEATHDYLSRSSHLLGFQGFKRWHKLQSKEDRSHRIELQHHAIDQFDANIEADWGMEEILATDIMKHLEIYLDWEISVYKNISEIANELTVSGFLVESCIVSKCLKDVSKEIEKVRRWIHDFKFVDQDKSYIKLCDKVLHDKVKKIEEK